MIVEGVGGAVVIRFKCGVLHLFKGSTIGHDLCLGDVVGSPAKRKHKSQNSIIIDQNSK